MNDSPVEPTDLLTGSLVVIQRNPVSGSGRRRQLLRSLIRELRQRDFRVCLFARRDRLDDFVRSAVEPGLLRCLVAAGGDGTIASLVGRHPQVPITTLPMGTENLIARHLAIPRCASHVADLIDGGHTQSFDAGEVGSDRFLVMASAGVDAVVVERLHTARSGNIRRWAYALPILRSFVTWPFPEFEVRSLDDDRAVRGTHVVVANFPEYGFNVKLTPDAHPADGLLDVRVYQGRSALQSTFHALSCRFCEGESEHVVRFRARRVRLQRCDDESSESSVPVQADGDPAGRLPVDIRVIPGAMRLVVPAPKL